jgi:hypothetical protein
MLLGGEVDKGKGFAGEHTHGLHGAELGKHQLQSGAVGLQGDVAQPQVPAGSVSGGIRCC